MHEDKLKKIIEERALEKQKSPIVCKQILYTIFNFYIKLTGKVPSVSTVASIEFALTHKSSDPQRINEKVPLETAIKQMMTEKGHQYSSHKQIKYPVSIDDITLQSNPNLLIDNNVLEVLNQMLKAKKENEYHLVDTPISGNTFIYKAGKSPKITYAFKYIEDIKSDYSLKRSRIFSMLDELEPIAEELRKRQAEKSMKYVLNGLKEKITKTSTDFYQKVDETNAALELVHKYDSAFQYDTEKELLDTSKINYENILKLCNIKHE
ncbi:MAG: hypothetical protein WC755_03060 [Candidatus Woesearchaeota archaeon]|jgi:hypothetical protein